MIVIAFRAFITLREAETLVEQASKYLSNKINKVFKYSSFQSFILVRIHANTRDSTWTNISQNVFAFSFCLFLVCSSICDEWYNLEVLQKLIFVHIHMFAIFSWLNDLCNIKRKDLQVLATTQRSNYALNWTFYIKLSAECFSHSRSQQFTFLIYCWRKCYLKLITQNSHGKVSSNLDVVSKQSSHQLLKYKMKNKKIKKIKTLSEELTILHDENIFTFLYWTYYGTKLSIFLFKLKWLFSRQPMYTIALVGYICRANWITALSWLID